MRLRQEARTGRWTSSLCTPTGQLRILGAPGLFARTKAPVKVVLLSVLLTLLAIVSYAFAAANVVPENGLGDGSGTISGYTITNVVWTPLASNPSTVDKVAMDVAPTAGAGAATKVRITVNGGVTWINCTGPVGSTWTCTFGTPPSASAASLLQVVAAQ